MNEFPDEPLAIEFNGLFCCACHEVLSLKLSTVYRVIFKAQKISNVAKNCEINLCENCFLLKIEHA